MNSDFRATRLTLMHALDSLQGKDRFSEQAREALDILVEALLEMEFAKRNCSANVVHLSEHR